MQGKTDAELMPAEEAAVLPRLKLRVLASGIGEQVEIRLTTKGEPTLYSLTIPCRK